jgi:hypothetical protein
VPRPGSSTRDQSPLRSEEPDYVNADTTRCHPRRRRPRRPLPARPRGRCHRTRSR